MKSRRRAGTRSPSGSVVAIRKSGRRYRYAVYLQCEHALSSLSLPLLDCLLSCASLARRWVCCANTRALVRGVREPGANTAGCACCECKGRRGVQRSAAQHAPSRVQARRRRSVCSFYGRAPRAHQRRRLGVRANATLVLRQAAVGVRLVRTAAAGRGGLRAAVVLERPLHAETPSRRRRLALGPLPLALDDVAPLAGDVCREALREPDLSLLPLLGREALQVLGAPPRHLRVALRVARAAPRRSLRRLAQAAPSSAAGGLRRWSERCRYEAARSRQGKQQNGGGAPRHHPWKQRSQRRNNAPGAQKKKKRFFRNLAGRPHAVVVGGWRGGVHIPQQ